MSRRRGEFEHRTSIFEGAYRAWSHLGGLDAEDLETKAVADLDPLTNPIVNDSRITKGIDAAVNPDGTKRREYPYEPLPRSGLAHPYVQAILTPWLGPEADNEAIQLGLTTLRTWWQHRRKGESGSAIAALGTEKMKGVVEGYTRHFFTLAHCLVVNEKVQPPRGLHGRMKELEKIRNKRNKKKPGDVPIGVSSFGFAVPNAINTIRADLTNPNLTPLEQLHLAQQHQMEFENGLNPPNMPSNGKNMLMDDALSPTPIAEMTGNGIPGKVDIPSVVSTTQMQGDRMSQQKMIAEFDPTSDGAKTDEYGDPNTTPVVFVSGVGDIQIAMKVDGITCSHCIKIVETVLRGCSGNRSPINGLLDAAADRALQSVLIKIDKASNAKRIAFEAKRNLTMVGYTARAMEMSIVDQSADKKVTMNLGALSTAFEVVAATDPQDVFDWTIPCSCPDNGNLSVECKRHVQMNTRIFEAFKKREEKVKAYMAGCAAKYGMVCTCGAGCRCMKCSCRNSTHNFDPPKSQQGGCCNSNAETGLSNSNNQNEVDQSNFNNPLNLDQPLDFSQFAMGPPAPIDRQSIDPISLVHNQPRRPAPAPHNYSLTQTTLSAQNVDRTAPNLSVLPYGNNTARSSNNRISMRQSLRGMSITSETTFGRAMSGLSVLSIDWENLDDFDLEVDHSAHVNNSSPSGDNQNPRRSSIRRSVLSNGSNEQHVAFKV